VEHLIESREGEAQALLDTSCMVRVRRTDLVTALVRMSTWLKLVFPSHMPPDMRVTLEPNHLVLEVSGGHYVLRLQVCSLQMTLGDKLSQSIAVPVQILLRACRSLDGQVVELGYGEKPMLYVQSGACRFGIACSPAHSLPVPEAFEPMAHVEALEGPTMHRLVRRLVTSMSKDDVRYGLNVLHIEVYGTKDVPRLVMVTTDGHRLIKAQYPVEERGKKRAVLDMYHRAARMLVHLLKARDTWKLEWSEQAVRWVSEDILIQGPISEGETSFPDYGGVIPSTDDPKVCVKVDRRNLSIAARRSVVMASGRENPLVFDTMEDRVQLQSRGSVGTFDQNLDAEVLHRDEHSNQVGLNANYIVDALRYSTARTVRILYRHPLSPIRIDEEDGEEEVICVVMPMRIDR
jgi:DNA polymerase-3 subunit beta